MQDHRPAKNVGPTTNTPVVEHPLRNLQILGSMVTTHTARCAVHSDGLQEEIKNCLCAVVVGDSESSNQLRLAIDEGMDYKLVLDQAYMPEE